MNDILSDLRRADADGVFPPQNWTTRAADEISRLRTELADLEAGVAAMQMWLSQIANYKIGVLSVEHSVVALRDAARRALSSKAGQKVLDVVRAAQKVGDAALGAETVLVELHEALSALGWKP